MRLIGHLDSESLAQRISGVLVAQGIHHQVEADDGPRWAVWIHAEEDLDRARRLLAAFRENPDDPAYRVTAPRLPRRGEGTASRPTRDAAARSVPVEGGYLPTSALVLLGMCVVVALMTQLGGEGGLVRRLQMSEVPFRWGVRWDLFLPEIRRGEVWRLLSPVFLHFSVPHVLFNLWAFWDMGRMIEERRGAAALLGLVVGLGVVSNLGQYLVSGPRFGGMSGVVYGLLGFAWMMGRYRPSAGIGLHPQTVVMMLVWFFICWFGFLGVPVANMAHGVGLVGGMLWGRWVAAREG